MPKRMFCTYCAARKNRSRRRIPAIRRYLSPRIGEVYRKSQDNGAGFAILSGRFGLLGPYQKIPHYDHLLKKDEIAKILPQMVNYINRKGYHSVSFFHEPLKRNTKVRPYCEAIKKACRLTQSRLRMVEIKRRP